MSQIDDLFNRLRKEGRKAFLPFITAGDPDLAMTQAVIEKLDELGCSMSEIGIPYSDPIADGPVIQASYTRALNSKIKLESIYESISQARKKVRMPLACMVSYAICYRQGLTKFVDQAKAAGFSGAIVPDLLVEESDALRNICAERDFSLIQLVTPTTPQERAIRIAEQSTGFLYFVSVTGITGTRQELPEGLVERISWLKARTDVPICIGFGISKPEHVRLLAPVADGIIVGSAIVKLMADAAADSPSNSKESKLEAIETLVRSLLAELELTQSKK